VSVRFDPVVPGEHEATLSIPANVEQGQLTALLTGTGIDTGLSVTPTVHDFGEVTVGGSSKPLSVVVFNTGNEAVTVTDVSFQGSGGGDFAVASGGDTCAGKQVPAGSKCKIEVSFNPRTVGESSTEMLIAHDGPGDPLVISLRGTGTPEATSIPALTPAGHAFGDVPLGGLKSFSFVLSNFGDADLKLRSVRISGGGGAFTADGCAGAVLHRGEKCKIAVVFRPKVPGTVSAHLYVRHTTGVLDASLSGRGIDSLIKPGGETPGGDKPGNEPKPGNPTPPVLIPLPDPGNPALVPGSPGTRPGEPGAKPEAVDKRVVSLGGATLKLLTAGPSGADATTLKVTNPAARKLEIASISCCTTKTKAKRTSRAKRDAMVVTAVAWRGKVRVGAAQKVIRRGTSGRTLVLKFKRPVSTLLRGKKLKVKFTVYPSKQRKNGVSVSRTFTLVKSAKPVRRR
jgi:hypothetical protein